MRKSYLIMFIVVAVILAVFFLVACEEKDSNNKPLVGLPPVLSNNPDLVVSLPPVDTIFPDSVMVEITYQGDQVDAVPLLYFINDIDNPGLYYYEIVGQPNNWSPRDSSNGGYDLSWSIFNLGYLLPSKDYRTYFEDPDLPSAFNVKSASNINLYRTIIVVKPDGEEVPFEINILEVIDIEHHLDGMRTAYRLKDLITSYITTTPENYEYVFTAVDGFMGRDNFFWWDMQKGVYIIETGRTYFGDTYENWTNFRNLERISLIYSDDIVFPL